MFATSHLWCSLPWWIPVSVGVFSCERIAAQFSPLWRKILLRRGQQKVRLSEGRPILLTFHVFLVPVGATDIFSELIHPVLKLPNCVLKQQLHILQLSEALGSAFSRLFEKQEQALSAYCHFHPLIVDLSENTTLYTKTTPKTAFAISREINHRMYQIYKEDGVVNRFLTVRRHFWTPWSERTHYMENGQSVFFFSRLTCPMYSGMWGSRACSYTAHTLL